MTSILTVDIGRTNSLLVSLGMDVSNEIVSSQIRKEKSITSPLLATWVVSNVTDGSDGELVFTLDESVTIDITEIVGYMDIKRLSGGKSISVLDKPIQVSFQGVVTS